MLALAVGWPMLIDDQYNFDTSYAYSDRVYRIVLDLTSDRFKLRSITSHIAIGPNWQNPSY
ncbi:MAG: hypothetical protein ABJH04_09185 [Cyclobacteriaceae bacterium]